MIIEEKMRLLEYYGNTLVTKGNNVVLTNNKGESQEFINTSLEVIATAVVRKMYNDHKEDLKAYSKGEIKECPVCPLEYFYEDEEKKISALTGQQLAGSADLGNAIYEILQGGYDDNEAEDCCRQMNMTLEEYWLGHYLPLSLEFGVDVSKVKVVYEKLKQVSSMYTELHNKYFEEFKRP